MRFKIYINSAPGDNPAQSDVCGHIGGNGNHPCRKCFVGGSQKDKETDDGFHSHFEVQITIEVSSLVITELRYPGRHRSFCRRYPYGCQVPG
jgi:hypothetical protein